MALEFEIKDPAHALDKLRALGPEMKKTIAKFAGRKAARVIAKAAQQNAQRLDRAGTPNSIAKNIAVQFGSKTFKRTGDILFRVGVRGGARDVTGGKGKANKGGQTFYWRFLEFGTKKMAARPLMRDAMASSTETAVGVFVASINVGIDKYTK